jgi:hypothetical protein
MGVAVPHMTRFNAHVIAANQTRQLAHESQVVGVVNAGAFTGH